MAMVYVTYSVIQKENKQDMKAGQHYLTELY